MTPRRQVGPGLSVPPSAERKSPPAQPAKPLAGAPRAEAIAGRRARYCLDTTLEAIAASEPGYCLKFGLEAIAAPGDRYCLGGTEARSTGPPTPTPTRARLRAAATARWAGIATGQLRRPGGPTLPWLCPGRRVAGPGHCVVGALLVWPRVRLR